MTSFLQRTLLGLSVLMGLMIVVGIVLLSHYLNPDVGLYLEMGQKVLDGQLPYVDYEEVNFPMIHWLNMLPVALSRLTGLAPTITFQLCMLALIAVACALLWRLFPRRRLTAAALIFGLTAVSWVLFMILQWGQREHIFTLLYLPFLALRVQRREGELAPVRTAAFTIGLMAGVGVAIKPYFALTAVLVEGVGLLLSRRWFLRTPEVIGVVLVAVLHIGYFALNPNVPQAFMILIGRLSDGYGAYISVPYAQRIPIIFTHTVLAIVPILVSFRLTERASKHLYLAFSVMGLGSIIGFIAQDKGWFYHGIPFIISNVLLCMVLFIKWLEGINTASRHFVQKSIFISTVGICIGIVAYTFLGLQRLDQSIQISQVYSFTHYIDLYSRPTQRVMVVDAIPSPTYPLLPALNRRSASRYAVAHPFPIAYFGYQGLPYTDPAHRVPDYIQTYLDHFTEDMARHQPPLFIIRSSPCGICSRYAPSLHEYFDARGILAEVIEPDYDLLAVDNGFHIYVRKGVTPNP